MSDFGHLMILASAGSGKTYALTTRFVRLLAAGAAPERIVALTFTRKAAGEFFDAILTRLALAAADPEEAERLATEIEQPDLTSADFRRLLRSMVEQMPRLNLGTMDGFFSQIVQAFPLELGLGGEFELLEEAQAHQVRQQVLARLFHAAGEQNTARQDFIESFKRATYGVEEKALQQRLDSFLDDHGETYRAAPDGNLWGNIGRIWPRGNPWLDDTTELAAAIEHCRAVLPWDIFNDRQRAVLENFLGAMLDWEAGSPLPQPAETPVKNVLNAWEAFVQGTAEIPVARKKVSFEPEAGHALAGVVRAIVGAELRRKLEITRGIHAVVRLYEERYDAEVRRAGRLTFADVQRLLQPATDSEAEASSRRLLMNWRLDARFDHWLLDEFQDTSREQWHILHDLIDEAVQDPEGERTFFYVGDVKQAIYGWRGGDARLFREIFDHYNAAQTGAIAEQHLAKSWRSAAPVIAMVNAVMGHADALTEVVPPAVVERWIREWRDHETARDNMPGYAALHLADDEESRWAETLSILQGIEAKRRGLTVAVLVQKNRTGAELAEYLRSEGGMAAVAESDLQVAFDNPFTSALLALLRWAAHPGDTFAAETVKMTPVGHMLAGLDWTNAAAVSAGVMAEVHANGFAGCLAGWVERMAVHLEADDDFSRLRGRQLIEAARTFDDSGSRDVDEFLSWIESYSLREAEAPGVVRVMTVHKAKGLGFDVVILPDLQGNSIAQRRRGLAVHRASDQSVDWVLDLPGKSMAERDPVLAQHMEEEVADTGYEALCKLYVAMTRAKHALHVIIQPVARSRSRNFPKLLDAALGESWQQGDPDWFEKLPPKKEAGEEAEQSADKTALSADRRRRRRQGITASGEGGYSVPARSVFESHDQVAVERGSAIHAILAKVDWCDGRGEADLRALLEGEETPRDWSEQVFATISAEATRSIFHRDGRDGIELWREKPFEYAAGNQWVTGIFDRVIIERDSSGVVQSARVVDFKTDGVSTSDQLTAAVERHRPQLRTYRAALMRMTGLGESQVEALLVFTNKPIVVGID